MDELVRVVSHDGERLVRARMWGLAPPAEDTAATAADATAAMEGASAAATGGAVAAPPLLRKPLNPVLRVLLCGTQDPGSALRVLAGQYDVLHTIVQVLRGAWAAHVSTDSIGAVSIGEPVRFPPFSGLNVNMMPIVLSDHTSLPDELLPYAPLLAACPFERWARGGVAYLTVHESVVTEEGAAQRRKGLHTEGGYTFVPSPPHNEGDACCAAQARDQVAAMRAHASDAGEQHSGCRSLARLARKSYQNQTAVAAAGAVDVVLAAMRAHAADAAVQQHGCDVLRTLADRNSPIKIAIVAAGGIAVLEEAVHTHAPDALEAVRHLFGERTRTVYSTAGVQWNAERALAVLRRTQADEEEAFLLRKRNRKRFWLQKWLPGGSGWRQQRCAMGTVGHLEALRAHFGRRPGELEHMLHWGAGSFTEDGSGCCNTVDGIYMASSVAGSTRVWNARIADPTAVVGPLGDLEHLRGVLGAGYELRKGELVWMTDCTPHESCPLPAGTVRQYFRLVMPNITAWYAAHSTPNPLGVAPGKGVRIVQESKFVLSAAGEEAGGGGVASAAQRAYNEAARTVAQFKRWEATPPPVEWRASAAQRAYNEAARIRSWRAHGHKGKLPKERPGWVHEMVHRATALLRQVLEIDPEHAGARSGLAALGAPLHVQPPPPRTTTGWGDSSDSSDSSDFD
jgi:hypothetical protein